jgi:hypothetical protein
MTQRLLNDVESFLSEAEVVIFVNVDKEVLMTLNFAKEKFHIFKDVTNYEKMNAYFKGRNITLRIIEQPTYYRGSLIDKNSGDCVNLNNVKFVTNNLSQFVNSVPTNIEMTFIIYGFKQEGKDLIRATQPIIPSSKPLIIHGYSYLYIQSAV